MSRRCRSRCVADAFAGIVIATIAASAGCALALGTSGRISNQVVHVCWNRACADCGLLKGKCADVCSRMFAVLFDRNEEGLLMISSREGPSMCEFDSMKQENALWAARDCIKISEAYRTILHSVHYSMTSGV